MVAANCASRVRRDRACRRCAGAHVRVDAGQARPVATATAATAVAAGRHLGCRRCRRRCPSAAAWRRSARGIASRRSVAVQRRRIDRAGARPCHPAARRQSISSGSACAVSATTGSAAKRLGAQPARGFEPVLRASASHQHQVVDRPRPARCSRSKRLRGRWRPDRRQTSGSRPRTTI